MGKTYFLSKMSRFISDGDLPLWVVTRSKGIHPSRLFHEHNYSEIAVITEGEAYHLYEDKVIRVTAGDVLIVHPGAVHAYDGAADMGIVNLLFDSSRLSLPLLDGYTLPLFKKILPDTGGCKGFAEPVTHLSEKALQELLNMLEKIRDELNNINPGRQLRSLAVFLEILVFLARQGDTDSSGQQMKFLIGDAVRYMNNHYAEPVKVEQLARKARMSLRSFTRHFPETVGCPPIEYLLKLRLHHASDLLINTDLTVSEISEQCGFYDSNYFCKKFRQAFNVSPRKFRVSYQSGKNIPLTKGGSPSEPNQSPLQ